MLECIMKVKEKFFHTYHSKQKGGNRMKKRIKTFARRVDFHFNQAGASRKLLIAWSIAFLVGLLGAFSLKSYGFPTILWILPPAFFIVGGVVYIWVFYHIVPTSIPEEKAEELMKKPNKWSKSAKVGLSALILLYILMSSGNLVPRDGSTLHGMYVLALLISLTVMLTAFYRFLRGYKTRSPEVREG
ncbi:hypothetical protein MYX06_04560 [Patescibacteria group bacterium AH-259-L05]|nr:hypothetical protein [Patescibacteria group bacterium AH-259-L05]